MTCRSDFLRILEQRGYLHQATNLEGLDARLEKGPITAYCGFDPTGDSFHVGNLVQIMQLRRLQQAGGKPILLLGGATARVGDPSDKNAMRPMLTEERLAQNISGLRGIFGQFLRFDDSPTGAVIVDNADWLLGLHHLDFLTRIGRHFTLNRLITFDFIRRRLEAEQPMSILEMGYSLLQAYDFAHLWKEMGCELQLCGADQWANAVCGIELARKLHDVELFATTTPLVTTADGVKMGKTAQGAVWLRADRLAPYDYWQFWRNVDDRDVGRFLRLFTDLPLDEIARLEALGGAEINEAKKILAREATTMCHGQEAAQAAAETARQTFEQGGAGEDLPRLALSAAEFGDGLALVEALVRLGLCASKGEARRLVSGGGAYLGGQAVADEGRQIVKADLDGQGQVKLSAGRKRHGILSVA
ncbi:MAG: tyrosine--tRNA ligase [Alphaproteobacteria bacterium]|nr:MAG: tyrosine--tRNA ligase [Alphaproteobacteria bacterium]